MRLIKCDWRHADNKKTPQEAAIVCLVQPYRLAFLSSELLLHKDCLYASIRYFFQQATLIDALFVDLLIFLF